MRRITEGSAPNIKNRSWSVSADVELKGGGSGVIAPPGGLFGGWALYFEDGKPVFSHTVATGDSYRGVGATALSPAKHTAVMDFAYDGGGIAMDGTATILVDGQQVVEVRVPKTVPFRFSTEETLDFGEDTGTPVDMSYDVPFTFSGVLGKIVIDLKERLGRLAC